MKRCAVLFCLILVATLACPEPARADGTAFFGLSPTPTRRMGRGFAVGVSLVVVGFEFEYANTVEAPLTGAPSVKTGMLNGLVMTPTKTQLYITAGGGIYREGLQLKTETNVGTNIGGGIKMPLAGPVRLRIDYRVFHLRGGSRYPNPQRFYAGLNVAF